MNSPTGQFDTPERQQPEPERLLREYNAQLEALTEHVPGGLHQCMADDALTFLSVSRSFLSLVGYTKSELETLFHNSFAQMVHPDDLPTVRAQMALQLQLGDTVMLEYRLRRRDGPLLWIMAQAKLAVREDGSRCFYCVMMDNTRQKAQQDELRLTLERHKVILDQTTDIIFEWDIPADTLTFSSNWKRKFGYDPVDSAVSDRIPISRNIHPDDVSNFVSLMTDVAAGIPYCEAEFRIRNSDDQFIWCRIRATTQYDRDHKPVKAVGVILDISADKRERQELLELARRDALTGLYNKSAVQNLTEQYLQRQSTTGTQALLILDVDNFKSVNDTFGHLCGDAVLSDIAAVLRSSFRASDLVGRIGGDEFLVYLPDVTGEEAVRTRVTHLLTALGHIRPTKDAPAISCSIGAALSPHGAADYRALYQQADQALYQRKREGKGGVTFYSGEDDLCPALGGLARSAVSAAIDSDMNAVDEQLAQYAFRMLYNTVQPQAAISQILEIVGLAYDVSRVYIFESSEDGLFCSNTFEWCGDGVSPEIDKLQNLSYCEDLNNYPTHFNEQGVFYCQDVRQLASPLYEVLAPQGICSMLQCAIMDNGVFRGYVGFDECRENRNWTREQVASLNLIANVLATFLVKLRLKEKLARLEAH